METWDRELFYADVWAYSLSGSEGWGGEGRIKWAEGLRNIREGFDKVRDIGVANRRSWFEEPLISITAGLTRPTAI